MCKRCITGTMVSGFVLGELRCINCGAYEYTNIDVYKHADTVRKDMELNDLIRDDNAY